MAKYRKRYVVTGTLQRCL